MPTDPNARRDKALSDITQALTKTNRLLETQNKILEKMERHARPTIVGQPSPYLERSEEVDPKPAVGTTPTSGR